MIAAKYDNFISVKTLSSHGLNHLPGYDRSLPYQRNNRAKRTARQQTNPVSQQAFEVPSRAVGKISDGAMVIPRIPSNHVTIKDDSIVVSSNKAQDLKASNTSIDDQILYHKLEITKLEHLKSIRQV